MKKVILFFLISSLLFSNDDISKFKIAIDIGHTPKRGGATSSTGKKEYYYNYRLANELHCNLIKKGFKNAFIINNEQKEISLLERCNIANEKKADLFISIHHDSVQLKYLKYYEKDGKKFHFSNNFSGFSLFVSKKNPYFEKSKLFSEILGGKLIDNNFTPTLHHAEKIKGENKTLLNKKKGIYEFPNLVVLKRTSMPSVLVEAGIIVNIEEEKKLEKVSYRKKLINSIVDAVFIYQKLK